MIYIGQSAEIYIRDDSNLNKLSSSNLGVSNSYETPNGMQPGSDEAKNYLAGDKNFTVEEIELYKLII
jgi:hypothetical protein